MIQDLIPDNPTHLKTLLACNRVNNHIAVYANKVLAVEYSILILASGIDHLDGEVLVPVSNDFTKRVFDRRVVGIDEVAIDVLDRERALAWDMVSYMDLKWGV